MQAAVGQWPRPEGGGVHKGAEGARERDAYERQRRRAGDELVGVNDVIGVVGRAERRRSGADRGEHVRISIYVEAGLELLSRCRRRTGYRFALPFWHATVHAHHTNINQHGATVCCAAQSTYNTQFGCLTRRLGGWGLAGRMPLCVDSDLSCAPHAHGGFNLYTT
eukprot:1301249-Prymnesium_polylepis.1